MAIEYASREIVILEFEQEILIKLSKKRMMKRPNKYKNQINRDFPMPDVAIFKSNATLCRSINE